MKQALLFSAEFRFYQELNDFLPRRLRNKPFPYSFFGTPAVKEVIEAIGVPHTEVDLILVNGIAVPFSHLLQNKDQVSVYPVYESFDVTEVTLLRPESLRTIRFIADVHLGKLVRYLRLLGFDTTYEKIFPDEEIIRRAIEEKRIILTRDLGILKNKQVTHGYWVRHADPLKQFGEVVKRFHLEKYMEPFTRCLECNGVLKEIPKKTAEPSLLPETLLYYETFYQCPSCKKIYWEGSHYEKMSLLVRKIKNRHPF